MIKSSVTGGVFTKNIENIIVNSYEFSDMPMCILKDHYVSGTRTHLISVNDNIVRPNNKLTLSFADSKVRAENVFSPYHFPHLKTPLFLKKILINTIRNSGCQLILILVRCHLCIFRWI